MNQIELVGLDAVQPYENNPRHHSVEQVEQIAESIRSFGFINPILVDEDNMILAGHGRYAAASTLQLESIPVLRVAGLSKAQKRAYIIADNRLAETSKWDKDVLRMELRQLEDMQFSLDILGFNDIQLSRLLNDKPPEFSPPDIEVTTTCPKCGYEW